MKERHRNAGESGQVLVMLALFLVALLAMTALVLDGGNVYVQRRRMQNAADAGALAGATMLAEQRPEAAEPKAREYAQTRNGADDAEVIVSGRSITVEACENTEMTFARVVGLHAVTVCAHARAEWSYLCGLQGLRPMAISDTTYIKDQIYYIWDKAPIEDSTNMSVRGWLDLDCTLDDGCQYPSEKASDWMSSGFQHVVSVGDWILKESGTKSYLNYAPVGQTVPIVMFQNTYAPVPGQLYVQVTKFLAFKVLNYYETCPGGKKGERCLQGIFVEDVTPTEPTPSCTAANSDWKTVYLTE